MLIRLCVRGWSQTLNSLRARGGDLVLWDLLGFIVEYTVFKGAEFKSDGRHAVKVEHFKLFTKIQYGRHRNTIYTLFDWKKYTLGAIFLISRRMWYVRILWLIIYKLRPFWEKSVDNYDCSDVITTVTLSPAENIETKRKKLHFSIFFNKICHIGLRSYSITIWYLFIIISAKFCSKMRKK